MSSRIELFPVFGCNPFEPRCFVLKIDEFRLLLDCGWDSRFDVKDLEALKSPQVDLKNIDAVLISQPDLSHLGALPYAYAKLGLNAPIFATAPIWRMGQYMLMDAFVAIHESHADFDLFTHEDIKKVFKTKFKSKLKYSQPIPLTKINNALIKHEEQCQFGTTDGTTAMVKRIGNSNTMVSTSSKSNTSSLSITPYSAGHMVGGTIWKISKETDNIIYAIDYNVRREKHLNESVFADMEIRPTLLITDAINIGHEFSVKRKVRENQLYSFCSNTIKNGGNVLIPSDSSGRCLEILLSLYQLMFKHRDFQKYHLVFLSYTGKNTLNSAKSMLEWMCDSCQRELNKSQKNVFEFRELLVCQSMKEFKQSIKFPYVVIATNEFLENGLSQELFINLSQHSSNQILLTQRVAPHTLAGKLLDIVMNEGNKNRNVEFVRYYKERLNEKEKSQYLEKQKEKEMELKEKEQKEREDAIAFDDEAENKDDDADDDGGSLNKISKSMDVDIHILDSSDVVFDASLNKRIKMSSNYAMYPFEEYEEEQLMMTEYGLKVDLNEWRAEPTKSPKKKALDEADEFEILARSISPSPNDVVNQTMALLRNRMDPSEPMKTVKENRTIFVKCQLKWLNIEGRSDEQSIKQTLPRLQPRQIILVHGSQRQKEDFKQFIVSENICSDVHIAQNMEWTRVKINTKYKKIIMDDVIERSLAFVKINGYDVSYLNGKLLQINEGNTSMDIDIGDLMYSTHMIGDIEYKLTTKSDEKKKENEEENDGDGDGDMKDEDGDEDMDDVNKMSISYAGNDGHSLTFLGDVTKIEMETNLKRNNIAAELYHGGTLVAGRSGEVRITHKDTQKTTLAINATLTADYFDIRDTVSSQYHLI